jgi:branched-chain amino acid transport system substrate-binding protein
MSRARYLSGAIAALLLLTATTACGGSSSPKSAASSNTTTTVPATPYRAIFIGALSGPAAKTGMTVLTGLKASADVVNASGGINGHKVQIETFDDQFDPTQAVTLLQDYIAKNGAPDFVLPGFSTTEGLALAPIMAREKILAIGLVVGKPLNNPTLYPTFFSDAPSTSSEGAFTDASLNAVAGKTVKTVGVFTSADAFGDSWVASYKEALPAGATLVDVRFDPTALDLSSSYSKLLDAHPDVVILQAVGSPAPRVLQARLKVDKANVPTVAGVSVSTQPGGLVSVAPAEALVNMKAVVYASTIWKDPAKFAPNFKAFYDAIIKQGFDGSGSSTVAVAGYGYDGLQLTQAAAKQAKSIKGVDIAKALEALKPPANPPWVLWSSAGYSYSPTNHFAVPGAGNFALIGPSKQVDGMYKE